MSTEGNIERSNPEVGYLADEVFKTFAFTQTIKAGKTLYLSGVAPLKGNLQTMQLVGEGDMRVLCQAFLPALNHTFAAN